MGNCHRRDEALPVTNFDDEKWCTIHTHVYPSCFLLKNYYHPNVKLFKWISSQSKQNKISQWRLTKKSDYLANIYEAGETSSTHYHNQQLHTFNTQKRLYIVTEELIRLKDLTLTQNQAAILAYRSLTAYREMINELGGFIARESMIYINREGVVKVWIHQNLANNEFQFPYPAVTDEQFISSLLHQIFTRALLQQIKIYDYIKAGPINFEEVLPKLKYFLKKYELPMFIDITKEVFDTIIDRYEVKSAKKNYKSHDQKKDPQENSMNKLKFIVADDSAEGGIVKEYVKDYSKKLRIEPTITQPTQQMGGSRGNHMFQQHSISSPCELRGSNQYSRSSFIVVNDKIAV